MPELIEFAKGIGIGLIPAYAIYLITRGDRNNAEFKAVTTEIAGVLRNEIAALSPNHAGLDPATIERLAGKLTILSKRSFRTRIATYHEAKSRIYQDEVGQPFYSDPEAIKTAIDDLLPFTKSR